MKTYGVASMIRIDTIIGLFCKRDLSKRRYSAKETNNFKEPTNRAHFIAGLDEEAEGRDAISSLL